MTVARATAMMFDHRVPPREALLALKRARRKRFGGVDDHFIMHCAGVCRTAAEENGALAQWETDGGSDA